MSPSSKVRFLWTYIMWKACKISTIWYHTKLSNYEVIRHVKFNQLFVSILISIIPDLDITVGLKNPFTTGFWTDSGIPAVMRGWHHCRFLKTDTDLQENSVGFWLHPTVSSWTTLPVCSLNRQWWLLQECRFLAQANNVEQAYTVGSWIKPAVSLVENRALLPVGNPL